MRKNVQHGQRRSIPRGWRLPLGLVVVEVVILVVLIAYGLSL